MGRKRDSQELGLVLYRFYVQLRPINLISSLNKEVCPKVKFHPWLAWTRPYKSRIGPKEGENLSFKSRMWYHKFFMYNYFQLTLFLVLIGMFH